MKFNKMLEKVAKTFAEVKVGGRTGDKKLAELDRGVLTVGLLVAALDGTILPEEYAAIETLAKTCRGGSAKNVRALLDAALPASGRLMAMAQVGVYSDHERLAAFLMEAKKALPHGFENGSMADVRRAFALWVAVGVADGEFSGVEQGALTALEWHYSILRLKKNRRKNPSLRLLERDFLAKAEKISRDLATPAKRSKAEAALDEFISMSLVVDGRGNSCSM